MNKMGGMCFNWKIIAALAAVGVGIWMVAPSFAFAALPLLLVLICPLSMLLMMRGMGGGQCATQSSPARRTTTAGLTREEQMAELKAQLAIVQAEHDAIAREIGEMEAVTGPTVRLDQGGRRMTSQLRERA